MAKFKIQGDKLVFNEKEFRNELFVDAAEAECHDTLGRITKAVGRGQDVNGGALKGYSASYKEAIRNKKVRAGTKAPGKKGKKVGVLKRSLGTNLRISGELLGSRQVERLHNGAECKFEDDHYSGLSNAQLAAALIRAGFRNWHAFGKKDLKRINKTMIKVSDAVIEKTLVVKKDR